MPNDIFEFARAHSAELLCDPIFVGEEGDEHITAHPDDQRVIKCKCGHPQHSHYYRGLLKPADGCTESGCQCFHYRPVDDDQRVVAVCEPDIIYDSTRPPGSRFRVSMDSELREFKDKLAETRRIIQNYLK